MGTPILAVLLLTQIVDAQPTPTPSLGGEASKNLAEKPVAVTEVLQVPHQRADELFSSALAWIGETYRSPKVVIELQDRVSGRIIAKCVTGEYFARVLLSKFSLGRLQYTVTIEVKDGRYRYTIGPFENIPAPVTLTEGGLLGPGYGVIMEALPPQYDHALDRKRVKTLTDGARATIVAISKSLAERMAKPSDTW